MNKPQQPALVVYFSDSGHTRAVAEKVAAALDADIEEIKLASPKRVPFFFILRAVVGVILRASWPIANPHARLDRYGMLILGSPIWGGRMAPPVRAWLHANKPSADLGFAGFFTVSGETPQAAFDEMAKIADHGLAATLSLNDKDRKSGHIDDAVEAFVEKLGVKAPGGPEASPEPEAGPREGA